MSGCYSCPKTLWCLASFRWDSAHFWVSVLYLGFSAGFEAIRSRLEVGCDAWSPPLLIPFVLSLKKTTRRKSLYRTKMITKISTKKYYHSRANSQKVLHKSFAKRNHIFLTSEIFWPIKQKQKLCHSNWYIQLDPGF